MRSVYASARGLLAVVAAVVCVVGVACTAISGVDNLHVGADTCTGDCIVPPAALDAAPDVRIVETPGGSSCACVGAPPPGWQGPVSLWEGAGAAPDCTGAYATRSLDAFRDPNAPAPACGCACENASGITCPSTFTVDIYETPTCGAAKKCDTVTVAPGPCANVQKKCTFADGVSGGPTPTGGSCVPKPGSTTVPPWSWNENVRTCATGKPPARESCDDAQVCVLLPTAPMLPRPCIFTSGDVACPAGGYAVKHVVYGGADDGRKCTACTCGAPTGAKCAATISKGCAAPGAGVALPTTCAPLGDPLEIGLVGTPVASGGACAPIGGKADGALVPTSPTTVCCVP